MERTAKLFKNGRNQAVRLPVDFEFAAEQVFIHKNEEGDVILSLHPSQPDDWHEILHLIKDAQVPADFLEKEDRNQGIEDRDPFEGID